MQNYQNTRLRSESCHINSSAEKLIFSNCQNERHCSCELPDDLCRRRSSCDPGAKCNFCLDGVKSTDLWRRCFAWLGVPLLDGDTSTGVLWVLAWVAMRWRLINHRMTLTNTMASNSIRKRCLSINYNENNVSTEHVVIVCSIVCSFVCLCVFECVLFSQVCVYNVLYMNIHNIHTYIKQI